MPCPRRRWLSAPPAAAAGACCRGPSASWPRRCPWGSCRRAWSRHASRAWQTARRAVPSACCVRRTSRGTMGSLPFHGVTPHHAVLSLTGSLHRAGAGDRARRESTCACWAGRRTGAELRVQPATGDGSTSLAAARRGTPRRRSGPRRPGCRPRGYRSSASRRTTRRSSIGSVRRRTFADTPAPLHRLRG